MFPFYILKHFNSVVNSLFSRIFFTLLKTTDERTHIAMVQRRNTVLHKYSFFLLTGKHFSNFLIISTSFHLQLMKKNCSNFSLLFFHLSEKRESYKETVDFELFKNTQNTHTATTREVTFQIRFSSIFFLSNFSWLSSTSSRMRLREFSQHDIRLQLAICIDISS
jgi:hypothetical protein